MYLAILKKFEFEFMLGFNDRSNLVGHFVLSPSKREKRVGKVRVDERQGQGIKENRNESYETE